MNDDALKDEEHLVTLILGSMDFNNYEAFKRVIEDLVPWRVHWMYTNQTEVGVGALVEKYADSLLAPLSVNNGDSNIQSRKRRLKARNRYYMDDLVDAVVIIWRGETLGSMRSIINKAKRMFIPLFVYNINTQTITASISLRDAYENKLAYRAQIKKLEDERRQEDAMIKTLLEYSLSQHKVVNIIDRVRHLRKKFENNA